MSANLNNFASPPAVDTVRAVLDRVVSEFRRGGIENPRYEAERILAHCRGSETWELYTEGRRRLPRAEYSALGGLIEDRLSRRPLAYILGRAGFYNLALRVDARSLIPRPETELLVELAIGFLEGVVDGPAEVVDLGCGCGTIALALAREYSAAVIGASDLSPAALELARENAESSGLADRIIFRRGDLLAPWADRRESGFDLIISNPPYLSDREWAETPPEVRLYEPPEALRGGIDGLDVIRRIIQESPAYLKPGGRLLFEIGSEQGEAVRKLVEAAEDLVSGGIIKDYAGRDRVVAARKIASQSDFL